MRPAPRAVRATVRRGIDRADCLSLCPTIIYHCVHLSNLAGSPSAKYTRFRLGLRRGRSHPTAARPPFGKPGSARLRRQPVAASTCGMETRDLRRAPHSELPALPADTPVTSICRISCRAHMLKIRDHLSGSWLQGLSRCGFLCRKPLRTCASLRFDSSTQVFRPAGNH